MAIDAGKKVKVADIDLKGEKWTHKNLSEASCHAAGYAFLRDDFINSNSLAELFLKHTGRDFGLFISLVKQLNGNFAIILQHKDAIFASVDRIRTFPIFYGIRGDMFLIRDDAHQIKSKLEIENVNPHAVEEFLMSGYVSQDETLYYGIKQFRAGEAVSFQLHNEVYLKNIRKERYYTYYNKKKSALSIDELIETYDDILIRAFTRLIKSVKDRQIVVPLSGGVDSRLVTLMLKKLGYKNVVCISYGVPNNWETNISRKVAERIGYNWIYIPYSRKKWHDAYRSKEWKDYFYSQDNLSSLPNIDEWIALRELKHNNSITPDAVFVPGHTGDFICGGHLQYVFSGKEHVTKEDLLNSILKKHYSLWKEKLATPEIRDYLIKRLSEFFENLPLDSDGDIADAYECWEWQERQAKFIVNSVKTYDFWGYEWRLPLWDSEVMDFWSAVPHELKIKRGLYLSYLKKRDEYNLFGGDLERKKLHKSRFLGGKFRKLFEYFRDTKGIYGIYDYFTVTFLNTGKKTANSILAKDYIKTLLKENRRNDKQHLQ